MTPLSALKFNRIFLVVLDGVGVGELPDAALYGDRGSDTLGNLSRAMGGLRLPALQSLGLGNLWAIEGVPSNPSARSATGRMCERSPGKDSVTGHWEMMGIVLDQPFPVYPNGFPPELIIELERLIGRKTLGNVPASGTEILDRLGAQHIATGSPIVYTSADSVFQIAAHEEVIPIDQLYTMCQSARKLLCGDHSVGRVIARPFVGMPGSFKRTERRKDFPLDPPINALDDLFQAGVPVHAIGKINEFFNGRSIHRWDATTNNCDHMAALSEAVRVDESGFVFANFEDFDMLFGHRNDCAGFAAALEAFDAGLGEVLPQLRTNDLLILTNDHGNDPTTLSTDHSREYAMLLCHSPAFAGWLDLGIRSSFADLASTLRENFRIKTVGAGSSLLRELSHNLIAGQRS